MAVSYTHLDVYKRQIRVQFGGYGGKAAGLNKPEGAPAGEYYCPDQYVYNTLKLVDYIRNKAGNEIELLHDTHERLSAINAVRLAKELEPYHLFFLEDILPPEQGEWYRICLLYTSSELTLIRRRQYAGHFYHRHYDYFL